MSEGEMLLLQCPHVITFTVLWEFFDMGGNLLYCKTILCVYINGVPVHKDILIKTWCGEFVVESGQDIALSSNLLRILGMS